MTTDFDVLEDMLVKDWDVGYSFSIRYKHLLVNRQGKEETDEDIDHILGVGSGEEGASDDDDDVKSRNVDDEDDEGIDDEGDSDEEMDQAGLTGQYQRASGYTNAPPYAPTPHPMSGPQSKQGKSKQKKNSKRTSELPLRPQPPSRTQQDQQGYDQPYPYPPPVDPWGRPLPYGGQDGHGGYGGYAMYGGYRGYGAPPDNDGRYLSQPPSFNGMDQYPPRHAMTPGPSQPDADRTERRRAQDSPFASNRPMQGGRGQPPFHLSRPGVPPFGYPQNFQAAQAEVKQESPESEMRSDGRDASVQEVDEPVNNDFGEGGNDAALEAELRATELELKVARLQARRAALNQQSRAK